CEAYHRARRLCRMPPRSQALLYELLGGQTPSSQEVRDLLNAFRGAADLEGQWFDVKAERSCRRSRLRKFERPSVALRTPRAVFSSSATTRARRRSTASCQLENSLPSTGSRTRSGRSPSTYRRLTMRLSRFGASACFSSRSTEPRSSSG